MVFRHRGRFAGLVGKQLEIFADDHSSDLDEIEAALAHYNHASAEEAEERYSEYADLVEFLSESLNDVRETYSTTLETDGAAEYAAVFDRIARQRFRHVPLELE